MKDGKSILIIISTGTEDYGKKAILGFTLAISALHNHNDVTIYLTKNGTIWCSQKHAKSIVINGIKTLENYIHTFLRMKGKLFVSSNDSKLKKAEEKKKHKNIITLFDRTEVKGSALIKKIAQESSVVSL